jgi:hypothetical protein
MAEPLRHRQTKEAATDMFGLQQPRHISTLPMADYTRPDQNRSGYWGAAVISRRMGPTKSYRGLGQARRALLA